MSTSDHTGLLVGPDQWFIPWPFVTRWKLLSAEPPVPAPTDYFAHYACDDQQTPATDDTAAIDLAEWDHHRTHSQP